MVRGQDEVIRGVADQALRFIRSRRKKLTSLTHHSMAVNPFLNPMVMELNGYETIDELTAYLIAGHLSDGHATGFGKLFDERIMPLVFGTTRLNKKYRREHPPLAEPMFGVIDHIVTRPDGSTVLLPLKAGRWSIQLGQAVNMNTSFARILESRDGGHIDFEKIVIGVLYGTEAALTDKFQIARGIGHHDLVDIRGDVEVQVGRDFWSWINGDVDETQHWVLDGLMLANREAKAELGSATEDMENYRLSYQRRLECHSRPDGTIDWHSLLREVNG